MNPKVSILLPAYKSGNGLLAKVFCKSWFHHHMEDPQNELIIYDNGGNGEELSCLKQDPNYDEDAQELLGITVIGDGNNVGLNKALNECAKIARGEYFYLPHTDMYLLPNCLNALVQAAKNHAPASFLFCSRSVEPAQGHTKHHIIKNYGQEAKEFNQEQLLKDFKDYKDNTIEFGARMPFFLHRKLWEKMGGVDEHYFSYCTDDDLIQEAWHCGVRKFYMVYDSLVYHLVGKSNQQQSIDRNRNEPYDYFIKKWRNLGYNNVEHPGQMHPKIIPFYRKVR